MKDLEKEGKQFEILQKKLNVINKNYNYILTLERSGNNILPYILKRRFRENYEVMKSKSFESMRDLYQFIEGIMYTLGLV